MVVGQRRRRSRPGHAFSVEPGHLLPRPVRHAARGHRRRDGRRARPAQRRAARPRGRRLSRRDVKLDAGDVPAAVGDGRPALLLGHDAPARGEPRLRLAAAQRRSACWRSARRRRPASPTSTRSPGACALRERRVAARASRSAVSVRASRRGCARARSSCAPSAKARVAAMVGTATRPTPMRRRPRAPRAGVPARARPRRAGRRRSSACSPRPQFAGGPYALAAVAARRRRGVPRRGDRRDAARPLVPRAARPARATRSRSSCRGRAIVWPFEVAVFLLADRAWCRCSTAPSTTATTACSAGSGSCARSRRSGSSALTWFALQERYYSAVMAATGLLYLAILTALRHRPRRPRRPRPLTAAVLA